MILNLSPEHLDWHGGEAVYRRDKLRLAELLDGGPLVTNAADPGLARQFSGRENVHWFNTAEGIRVDGGRLLDGAVELPVERPEGLPGAHNLANLAAVLTAVRCIGEDPEAALRALPRFRPLPHRLQWLGEREQRQYVNDSISSTPVATVAALESFAGQPVVLIVGGLDRGLDWSAHAAALSARQPEAVLGIPDNGVRILDALRSSGMRPPGGFHDCADLAEAVERARGLAPAGGVVLLSPGAPSFPRYRDYRDRGCRFAELCGFEAVDWDPF
jgi:UDP-N-acetylmuramoylalanine--D-glutamate ligase